MAAAPKTPDRTGGATTIRLSDGELVTARIDHKESEVPIWQTDRFVPLDGVAGQGGGPEIGFVGVESVPGAFVLENFFSPVECDDIVRCAETMGFDQAKVTTTGGHMLSMPNYRSNERVIWHTDPSWLEKINARLMPFLQRPSVADLIPGWKPYAINERMRIFKYSKGQQFKMHFDGGFAKNQFDRSHMTFIAYLGTPEDGGHTGFYSNSETEIVTVPPVKGSALIFFHQNHALSPLHSGKPVVRGTKYALRSDIMFRKLPLST